MSGFTMSENSGVVNSYYGLSAEPIFAFVESKGEAFEANSLLNKTFSMQSSKRFGEKIASDTAFDNWLPVGENGNKPKSANREGYSKVLEHMTWKNSFSISHELADDCKAAGTIDLVKQKPQRFLSAWNRTREEFGSALYGAAIKKQTSLTINGKVFSSATADGVCLFATNHPSILGKATQSNQFSDAFSADALAAVETEMQNFKGDNGEILSVCPDTIMIPNIYTLKKAVFEVIGADKDPATANNGSNCYLFGRWNVIINPYLNNYITSGTSPWALLDSRYMDDNLAAVWFDREKCNLDPHIDHDTDAWVWGGISRFSAGFADWRFAAVGGVNGGTQLVSA